MELKLKAIKDDIKSIIANGGSIKIRVIMKNLDVTEEIIRGTNGEIGDIRNRYSESDKRTDNKS